ncbi:CBS and ACT domain-containing protein [Desulfonema magnum]|uniref:CBS domain-containing protein n=1 Tax=Desulfonema magnum TaxID=45655 RepID=A0A975BVE2_9BACT|nr:CBS and ACT domain-containing protein [Desulfonema magnum]QTA91929.1 CBS domain-containing protein [Desulfonema magnum]
MLVRNWMSRPVISIDADDSMQDAITLLKERHIHMLPVMRKGKLAGIVTDGDLKRASASDATTLEIHELLYLISKIKVKDIMTKDPVTVPPDYTIEETADVLSTHKISGVPVIGHKEQLAGIITQTDLFRVIMSLSGFGKRGVQFGFQVEDSPGTVAILIDMIREYGGRVVSILTSNEGSPEGYRSVYIRAYGISQSDLLKLRQVRQERTALLYIVDHRENRREIVVASDEK